MAIRKKATIENLATKYSYIINDTSATSDDLFNIVHFPSRFHSGKNLFKLRVDNDNFVENSLIHIEILDYNGNAVYWEPLNYVEKDGTRIISVYIYPDTSPGPATVYIAGRVLQSAGDRVSYSRDYNSPNHADIPNAIWSRKIPIAPYSSNNTEIIYTVQPALTIRETVHAYLQPVNVFNVYTTVTSSNATLTIRPPGSILNSRLPAVSSAPEGALSSNSPNFGTQFFNPQNAVESLLSSNSAVMSSPTLTTLAGFSRLTTTNFPLSPHMQGGILTVNNPVITAPSTTGLDQFGRVIPLSQIGLEFASDSSQAPTNIELSGSYQFAISQVLNSTTAQVSLVGGFKNDDDNTFAAFSVIVGTGNTSVNSTNNQYIKASSQVINTIQTATSFSASFTKPTDVVVTENSSSFADIIISNIEPATGDVYRVKTLYKPSGFFGDFIDLGDTILEQQNILVDTGSYETLISVGSAYEQFGSFEDIQEINTYWTSSSMGTLASNALSLSFDSDIIMGGAVLSTNWSGPDQYTSITGNATVFNIKSKYRPTVFAGTTYIVKFQCGLPTDIEQYTESQTSIDGIRLDVFVSGSAVVLPETSLTNVQLNGNFNANVNATPTLLAPFNNGGVLGTRIGTVHSQKTPKQTGVVKFEFVALKTGPIDLKFVTRTGKWIIGSIEVLADKQTGFTPNYVRIFKRIPTEHLKTPLTFKFQYYDYQSKKADTETIAYGSIFTGGNTYIDGTGNLLTGSVYVGSSVGSGIELAGVSSGFIRSIGYSGFTSATTTGSGGFLIWSGSNNLTIGSDTYLGVGLELVASSASFFRYRTNPSELVVQTDKFFLGSVNQFISGANGQIEISSSNFHLSAGGNVNMSGTITATAGNIGGFSITSNAISSSNNTLILRGNTGQITGSNVLFTGGKIAGFTLSNDTLSNANNFFISGSATGNQFFISSSKFNVKANGDVTASSALFSGSVSVTGNINATTGNIGGFAITQNAITGSGVLISGSATTGTQFFISASKFNVKGNGDVTGSSVLFTGGNIGSFTLTNNALSGLNSSGATTFLISSSVDTSNLSTAFFISSSKFNVRQDGTISGSQVLFDGGKVGGFTIDSSKISGTNIVIDSAGSIQTSDYASDLKGWKISAADNGFAEFENAKIRGTLSTAVFEKQSVNAVGGQLYVANSTVLTGSSAAGASTTGQYTATQTTMSVENVTGFETGEILTAKKFSGTGFATEYLYVNSASRDGVGDTNLTGRLYVTRAYGNGLTGNSSSLGESPSTAQSYSGSQVIVSTGKLGTGFIRINANPNDTATPYIDIVERTGSGIYDVALKARLGDLSGLAGSSYVFGKSSPGFGLATDNVFLQGGIIANTGSIGGINMASSKLFTGTGTYNNSNTGFYLDNTGQFSLKDKLAWDGTTLSIVGQIEVSNGSFVPGSSLYQHGPLTYWPRINGTPPNDKTVLPNAYWNAAADNAIEYVMGPYGTQELAITCYPDAAYDGDGGFNTTAIPIDSGSAYMFVVYMKRTTNSTHGEAYFGLNGYNAAGTEIGVMSNAVTPTVNTNPYFMAGDIIPAGETAADSLNRWMLHVGYVYPSGSVYDAARTSILYDLTTGLTASYGIQPTYTWQTGTTATIIRAYHFYNTFGDGNTKYQEIARPGIFKMDGTEPTIQSLLSNTSTGGSTKIDGSTITTGKIRSTNYSTTLGSELDLNAGTITLGGSTSPKFNVNASGDVTASSALFSGSVSVTGNINATAGNIGGFAITQNAITGSGFYLSGSATGNQFFISSSKFNVKANGDVTASNANIGGRIEALSFVQSHIKLLDSNSGSYQTAGSSVAIKNLVFDGSAGGNPIGAMTIATTTGFQISGITTAGGSNQLTDVTLFISTAGVTLISTIADLPIAGVGKS